ncbi:unnamed protein product [Candidula unifasciata]|uniref:Receptor expression-enhancing protein n=1 Tax=Candidula unifasciata TaxID=100452 RepID=A0A8S3YMK3_9EUPU|nr:unnamed protein product [Candidula unifasciata]
MNRMVELRFSAIFLQCIFTLFPAYLFVKWMMYWIVFALFCTVETFSDFLLSWFPFYYEFKIVFVLWLLSPFTQGSSFLFRKFVHPQLARREKDIDELIDQTIKQGYSTFFDLGNKGIKVILKSVITGQSKLVDHLRHSYSTSDLSNDGHDIVPRQDAVGDREEEKEYELDNRLIEDQAELALSSTASISKSRGSSSALSLSSVKEEDGEDSEQVTTKTFTIPSSTRRHYSAKERYHRLTRREKTD